MADGSRALRPQARGAAGTRRGRGCWPLWRTDNNRTRNCTRHLRDLRHAATKWWAVLAGSGGGDGQPSPAAHFGTFRRVGEFTAIMIALKSWQRCIRHFGLPRSKRKMQTPRSAQSRSGVEEGEDGEAFASAAIDSRPRAGLVRSFEGVPLVETAGEGFAPTFRIAKPPPGVSGPSRFKVEMRMLSLTESGRPRLFQRFSTATKRRYSEKEEQMDFYKTTVLPLDNPAEAQRLLNELIHGEPEVLFVVLGTGTAAESLVSKAGKFAGTLDDQRWVVWARKLDDVRPVFDVLKETALGKKDAVLRGAAAFTLSISDEIRDVLAANEVLDNVRVQQAYVRAEAP